METCVPPFLECITEERCAVLLEAWRKFKGIPALAELMRIGNQLDLDFRVVRYWFYCRANYKGLARAFDALRPQQRLEFPKLEEYYLFDRFSDDLDDFDDPDPEQFTDQSTDQSTAHAPGPANDASPSHSQPIQSAHARPESSSSVSTPGRLRRASTTAKKQPQKPSTLRTKKQQRPPTQEPNENSKRRQGSASDDREVREASKARTKRNKTTPEALPEAAPAAPGAAASGATEPALTPSDDVVSQHVTTTAGPTLSMTTAAPSDMDSAPSVLAATTQETATPTSSLFAGAADVDTEHGTVVAKGDPSNAGPSAATRKSLRARKPKMILEAAVTPPYKRPLSRSSSSSSNRSHITTSRLPPSALEGLTLENEVSRPAIETATTDALTPECTPRRPFKLIRNRMEPRIPSRRASNSDESINFSTNHAGADPATEQEAVRPSDEKTTAAASAENARSKAKVDMGSKRRAKSAMSSSDSDPNTPSTETQSETRSKSAPLSGSRAGEPESPTQPESPNLREQVLQDSDQGHVINPDSGSPPHTTGVAPVPIEEETLNTTAGDRMIGEAEEVMAREDQGEGHLGTVHSTSYTSSKAKSSPHTTTFTSTETGAINDAVQEDRQTERLPDHPRLTRLSRSRSRGPTTAPTRTASQVPSQTQVPPQPQVPGPDVQAVTEPIRIMTEQYNVSIHAPENKSTGQAASSKRQQDGGASAQLMWDQPWTKQYASIKPMKRRSAVTENSVVPSPSKPSQSTSKTSSSNSINIAMVPDERLASEKIIISMDQTPPTPKSTDDADRQARKAQNNDLEQPEDAETTEAPLTPVFSNEIQYMEAQTDEMIACGSSYSPDATYDCLSATDPYHSNDSWPEGLDVDNDMLMSPGNRGRNRKNILPADDRDIYARSRREDRRPRHAGRSRRLREHGDHSRDRGYRRSTHRSSDRVRGRSRDRSENHSSRAHRSRDRSKDRTLDRPGKAHRSRERGRSRDYASRSYRSNDRRSRDRSRDRFEGHTSRPYHTTDRPRDRSRGHSTRPHHTNDRMRDRVGGSTSQTRAY